MEGHNQIINWTINGISIGAIVTSLLGFVPSFAALIAAVYYGVQVWESETVRRWRSRRHAQKVAALEAKLLALKSQDPAVPLLPKT